MVHVFDYADYRRYLNEALPSSGENRGARSAFARALKCRPAFISQVLSSQNHLSLEHCMSTALYMGLSERETDYFIALFQENRAGTVTLKKYFREKREKLKQEHSSVSARVKAKNPLNEAWATRYYSHWMYAAIHIAVTLPQAKTRIQLAEKLGLSRQSVNEAVEFLVSSGLLVEEAGKLSAKDLNIHISPESPSIRNHHLNWRVKAMAALEKRTSEDLHYSGLVAVSKSAAEQIRKILLNSVEEMEPQLQTQEEALYCLSLDFFGLVASE